MKNFALQKEAERIKSLIKKFEIFTEKGDFEGQSDWAKYICVIVAGYMELVIKELYSDYSKSQVSAPVARFISATLQKVQNPRSDKFIEFAGRFSADWGTELETYLNDNGRKEAIESIMTNRHNIAHGKSRSTNITAGAVSAYFEKCLEVANFIEQQCKK